MSSTGCTSRSKTSSILRSIVLLFVFLLATPSAAERQARFTLRDDTPAGYNLGNIAEQTGLSVPVGGFPRVLIDRLPAIASKHFRIDKRAQLTVGVAMDRDQLCTQIICCYRDSCTFSFRVFITTARSDEQVQVEITLRDENDNGPKFSANTVSLLENTPVGSSKPLPKATDRDSPNNGVKSYRLIDKSRTFQLIMAGPNPMLRVERPLDREEKAAFTLIYEAIDGGASARTGRITLQVIVKDVNDNAPKFEKRESSVTVKEDMADGSRVAHLKTTDNDEGENGQVTYRLTADSTPVGLANTLFAVGPTSGVVTVAKPLDFEDNRQASGFVLYVVAADKGKPPRSSTATLRIGLEDVNDNPPVIKLDGNARVIEGDAAGNLVATVTVKDADQVSQGKVNCALIHGNGFRLQPLSSLLLDLFTTRTFDHERESSVEITLECRDEALPAKRVSENFKIPIIDRNDNDPKFVGGNGIRRIVMPEDRPVGREVIHLVATDADSGARKAITYSLRQPGPTKYFSIHRDSGRVFIQQELDREKDDRVEFSVVATDGGTPPRSSVVNVKVTVTDVNDNAPRLLSPTSFTVEEGTPENTLVARLNFEDKDFGLNGTWLTQIGHKANVANTMFRMMSDGRLLTKSVIDRESYPSLLLEVLAFDNGTPGLTTTVALSITIADKNDNAPMLIAPNPGSIIGNSPPLYATAHWNTTIVRLRGRDRDKGANGTFFFSLMSTNATSFVGLERRTGRLYTTWAEGKGKAGFYYITVQLQDYGTPPMRSTAMVYLHIGESGPMDRLRGAAVNNIVILALIIVCSVALAISLIVAIVWARSRISRTPGSGDGRDPYADYDLKVPDESMSDHNMDEEEHHPPLPGHRSMLDPSFKGSVAVSDDDYVDHYHHCSLARKDPKSAPMQTFSPASQFRSVVFMPIASPPNGTLQRGPEQHRGPISPERVHLRRHSDASNEDSGKGGSDDNLSKCSMSNPPGSISSRAAAMYVRRPYNEGTMC